MGIKEILQNDMKRTHSGIGSYNEIGDNDYVGYNSSDMDDIPQPACISPNAESFATNGDNDGWHLIAEKQKAFYWGLTLSQHKTLYVGRYHRLWKPAIKAKLMMWIGKW